MQQISLHKYCIAPASLDIVAYIHSYLRGLNKPPRIPSLYAPMKMQTRTAIDFCVNQDHAFVQKPSAKT